MSKRLRLFSLLLASLFFVGCASTSDEYNYSDTMEIIRAAADAAPNGVKGEYTLKIKASGKQREIVYLNTELDYRDQRAITVAIHPAIIEELSAKYGSNPQEFFVGKSISVKGEARRMKIAFYAKDGTPSGKYYYQTHIRVRYPSQIKVLSEGV